MIDQKNFSIGACTLVPQITWSSCTCDVIVDKSIKECLPSRVTGNGERQLGYIANIAIERFQYLDLAPPQEIPAYARRRDIIT